MPFLVQDQKTLPTQFHLITIGGENLELEFRRPTYDDVCNEIESSKGYIDQRLKSLVVGWRGVNEEIEQDGKKVSREIPFSWGAFVSLCSQAPEVVLQASAIAANLYRGLSGDAEKN